MAEALEFLGIRFSKMPDREAVDVLLDRMRSRRGGKVYFVNANSVVVAQRNLRLQAALRKADMILADGSGVLWGSKLQGTPLEYNLNGTDLVPKLLEAAAPHGLSVYILGGGPGIAEEAARRITQSYPGVQVAGWQHGFYEPAQEQEILRQIRQCRPHLLLVAKGSPLQESWIDRCQAELPGTVCLGVGGLLDFMTQRVRRAPQAMRLVGMEWLWRLIVEPRRLWRRYVLGNVVFLGILVRAMRQQSAEQTEIPAPGVAAAVPHERASLTRRSTGTRARSKV